PTASRIFGGINVVDGPSRPDKIRGPTLPSNELIHRAAQRPRRRAPRRGDKSCDHLPGGPFVVRSLEPTAVSASSISRFLGLGACAVAAAGSIDPSITLTEPPACGSSNVCRYSTIASSSWSDRLLITLLCSTLCSRGTSNARTFR